MQPEVKVAVIGEMAVGKTSLLQYFVTGKSPQMAVSTTAASYLKKTVEISGQVIKYQIWDTAGQERFRALSAMYYRSAPFIIIVYDVTSRRTFDDVRSFWVTEIRTKGVQGAQLFLVANKIDLMREISKDEGQTYASQIKARYFECSARNGTGVTELFTEIGRVRLAGGGKDEVTEVIKDEVAAEISGKKPTVEKQKKEGGCC